MYGIKMDKARRWWGSKLGVFLGNPLQDLSHTHLNIPSNMINHRLAWKYVQGPGMLAVHTCISLSVDGEDAFPTKLILLSVVTLKILDNGSNTQMLSCYICVHVWGGYGCFSILDIWSDTRNTYVPMTPHKFPPAYVADLLPLHSNTLHLLKPRDCLRRIRWQPHDVTWCNIEAINQHRYIWIVFAKGIQVLKSDTPFVCVPPPITSVPHHPIVLIHTLPHMPYALACCDWDRNIHSTLLTQTMWNNYFNYSLFITQFSLNARTEVMCSIYVDFKLK